MFGWNGILSGEIIDLEESEGQQQWIFGEEEIVVTMFFPEQTWSSNGGVDNGQRAQYASKSVFKGSFEYSNDRLASNGILIEMGSFFSQRNRDGSTKETGYGYQFPDGTTFPIGDADDAARSVIFSYSNDKTTSWGSEKLGSFPIGNDRSVVNKSGYGEFVPKGWGDDPFLLNSDKSNPIADDPKSEQDLVLNSPSKFKNKYVSKIFNFSSLGDVLEINSNSFGVASSATFAAGKSKKEVKKKLAKRDIDFLYDQKKGGFYFNENGADKGFGDGGIIAILKGAPDLTSSNLEFI